jgi:hypothetical protein
LVRTLVCKLSADMHNISPEVHRECRFGQWHYGKAPEKLGNHPGLIGMGEERQRMHHLAALLLIAAAPGFAGDT